MYPARVYKGILTMKCFDWEILSRYQDGSLEESRSRLVCEHLMECSSCQARMRTLGRAGLFFRIAVGSHRDEECPSEEELGAYLSGRMRAEDRRRIEGHLVACSKCLHEVAVLSDPEMLRREAGSPVPDMAALARFRGLVPRRSRRRPALQLVTRWGLRAAAALLLVTMALGQMWAPRTAERSAAAGGHGTGSIAGIGGHAFMAGVSLSSDSALLQPDSTDLAQFAREAGLILREIERIAQEPRLDSFRLVQEDILNSGIVEGIARLKEHTSGSRDRNFLGNCEYLLMQVVKAESAGLDGTLNALISEIRRLNLIETARLLEMEGGRSQWLAGL